MTGINVICLFVIIVCAFIAVLTQKPEHYANTQQSSPSPSYTPETRIPTLSDNVCSVKCCPGEFGCSGGCICLSKQQRDNIGARGNNANGADPVP
jgi:hypothetical protein